MFNFFASHVSSHSIFVRCQFFFWSGLLPILSVRFLFLKCHFFFDFCVSRFLFPVHFCQMPVFHLELFASHFFRPIPFSKVPFFFDFFVSHFLFPVHFCQMPVFHLELFASHLFRPFPFSKVPFFFVSFCFPFFVLSPFLSDASFSLGVVSFPVSVRFLFLRCHFFCFFCLPLFRPSPCLSDASFSLQLFASHFFPSRCQVFCLLPIFWSQSILLPCKFFPWSGLLPIGPVRVISPKVNFILGTHFFPVIGSHTEGFFHASACHLLSSHQGRLLPNLRLATCGCHVLLPRRIFLQISSEPAPATTGSTPIKHVSIQDLALPSAPATFPSGMFPSEPSPCHVRLPVFPRRGFLDVPSGRIGPPKAK